MRASRTPRSRHRVTGATAGWCIFLCACGGTTLIEAVADSGTGAADGGEPTGSQAADDAAGSVDATTLDAPSDVGSEMADGSSCTPGATRCSGNGVDTCGANDQWGADLDGSVVPCTNQTCIMGECLGVCAAGNLQCAASIVQLCNIWGAWQDQTTCAGATPACWNGACLACTPGRTQCSGNAPQTCDSSGEWISGVQCPGSTPVCMNGSCIAGDGG